MVSKRFQSFPLLGLKEKVAMISSIERRISQNVKLRNALRKFENEKEPFALTQDE